MTETVTAEYVNELVNRHCEFYEGGEVDAQAIADELNATLGTEINGETSDGYHTFNELYHHRAVLFSVIVRDHSKRAWKARKHHDGTMYDGMFIVGIETPSGQATYHYDLDPYWDMFDCEEREFAPEWDGHTPDEAIARIATLGSEQPPVDKLIRCLENDYGITASWDGLRKVWLTERATLGRGECENVSYRVDESRFHCSECGFGCWVKNVATGRDELPAHCPNCGRKVKR